MAALPSSGDPDVDAAFSGAPAPPEAVSGPIATGDPDVDAALRQMRTERGRKKAKEAADSSLAGRAKNLYGGAVEPILSTLTGALAKPISDVAGLAATGYDVATGNKDGDPAGFKREVEDALTYAPRTDYGKATMGLLGAAADKTVGATARATGRMYESGLSAMGVPASVTDPLRSGVEEAVRQAPGFIGARSLTPKAPINPADAQGIADAAGAGQSMGAAGAAANLTSTTPALKAAIVQAAQKTGGAVNRDALVAHVEADSHGVQLTRGQATRDPIQFSEEQNSTDKNLVKHFEKQNTDMIDAIDNIRREASPTTVGNDAIQNGQQVVDALKAYDEPIKADIAAKYKALIDANGGTVPMDTGALVDNVDKLLKKNYLTASLPPPAQELMSSLRAGEPLDFERFEAARSRLAEAQRQGGSEAAAAGIVRNQLEQLPLSAAAEPLKEMADSARAAARSRFQALERDPAYRAAVEDDVKQGEPSPLADKFLDKYALNAPKANLDVMLQKLGDESKGAIASHALNAIRKAAVNANGQVLPNGYNGALRNLEPKIDSLVTPETRDALESLGRTITRAKVAPAGNYVNYSKSGVIINAAKGAAEHALNTKTFGAYGLGKKIFAGDKFAKDALKPGAGLEDLRTKP